MVLLLILTAVLINIFFTKAFVNLPLASAINIFFGILLAVIIWLAGLWSAADAKLFIAIIFLFPVTFYENAIGHFPGFSLFINFSIPLFLFLFLHTLLKTSWEEKKQALILHLKLPVIFRLVLIVTALYFLAFLASRFFNLRLEYLLWLILLFTLLWFIEQKLKIKMEYFCGFLLFLTAVFFQSFFTLKTFIFISILSPSVFLLICLISLATPLYTQPIKINNLREGMVLAEMVIKKGENYTKRPINFITFLSLLRERSRFKPVFGYNPDGLGPEGVKRIKSLYGNNLLKFDEIKVSKTFPFAPILFSAGLLTYFFKGSFIYFFFS